MRRRRAGSGRRAGSCRSRRRALRRWNRAGRRLHVPRRSAELHGHRGVAIRRHRCPDVHRRGRGEACRTERRLLEQPEHRRHGSGWTHREGVVRVAGVRRGGRADRRGPQHGGELHGVSEPERVVLVRQGDRTRADGGQSCRDFDRSRFGRTRSWRSKSIQTSPQVNWMGASEPGPISKPARCPDSAGGASHSRCR